MNIFSWIEIHFSTCLLIVYITLHGVRCGVLNMEFSFSGKGPREMNFGATNVAETWRKWRQNMQLYINATMLKKTQKEKYSFFLFSISEAGQEIFNTWIWPKVLNYEGKPADKDDITIAALFKKFED